MADPLDAQQRYIRALHAMQTGVKFEQEELNSTDGSPKHLRVGINSAHVGQTALIQLLIRKGVFTLDEYYESLADEMEIEVKKYEELIAEAIGHPVHLL